MGCFVLKANLPTRIRNVSGNKLTRSARVLFGSGYRKILQAKQYEVAEGGVEPRLCTLRVALLVMKSLLRHLTLSSFVNSGCYVMLLRCCLLVFLFRFFPITFFYMLMNSFVSFPAS